MAVPVGAVRTQRVSSTRRSSSADIAWTLAWPIPNVRSMHPWMLELGRVVNRSSLVGNVLSLVASLGCGPEASAPAAEPNAATAAPMDEDQARVLSVINAERSSRELPPVEFVAE